MINILQQNWVPLSGQTKAHKRQAEFFQAKSVGHMAVMCYKKIAFVFFLKGFFMAKKVPKELTAAYNSKQQKLLRKLPFFSPSFQLGSFEVNLLDLHFFPGHVDKCCVEHLHSFVEFHVPVYGSGAIVLGDKKHNFKIGTFTVTAPEQVHKWEAVEKPMLSHIWWYQIKQVGEEENRDIDILFKHLLNPPKAVYKLPEEYFSIYEEITSELEKTGLCYQQVCTNLIQDALILFARAMAASKRKKTLLKSTEEASQDHIVKMVESFLIDNLSQPLLLDDIARNAHVSRRNLTRRYKKITGQTIGEKLHELRMYQAEEMIRETELQIKAVSYKCGFQHISHFAKKYKEFFGFTPTEYRERLKSESLKGYAKWQPHYLKLNK